MTAERISCKKCGAMILLDTADRCFGYCMPCYRKSPEMAAAIEKEFRAWIKNSDYRNIFIGESKAHGQLSPVTKEEFEKKYFIELPEDLVQLMMHQNGGWFHQSALVAECLFDGIFPIILDPSANELLSCMIPVYEWLGIRGDIEEGLELEDYREMLERLIILDTDGHFYTCLDYRNGESCAGIVSVHIEGGFDGDVEKLGDSFKELFNYW